MAGGGTSQTRGGGPNAFVTARVPAIGIDPYVQRGLDSITRIVDAMVGQPGAPGVSPAKHIKTTMPEPYLGQDNHDLFELFL